MSSTYSDFPAAGLQTSGSNGPVIPYTGFASVFGMQPPFYAFAGSFYSVGASPTDYAYAIRPGSALTLEGENQPNFNDTVSGSSFATFVNGVSFATQFLIDIRQSISGDFGIGFSNTFVQARVAISDKVNAVGETAGAYIGTENTTDGTALRVYTSDGFTGTISTVAVLDASFQRFEVIIVCDTPAAQTRYYLNGVLVATHATPGLGYSSKLCAGYNAETQGWLSAPIYNVEL